jgi:hypothetical protein
MVYTIDIYIYPKTGWLVVSTSIAIASEKYIHHRNIL